MYVRMCIYIYIYIYIGSCTTPCDEGCTFCTAAEDEPGPKYIWQDGNPIRCELETIAR